ncbi:GNAT family N-acetyltransferase [Bacillus sp. JJ1474]
MNFETLIFNSIPDDDILGGIVELHKDIFGKSDNLINKMASKPQLLIITAMSGTKLIGFKIGYALDDNKFYSWMGGVDINYRKFGVASTLMEKQHQYVRELGYSVVQTKTMNK